MLWLLFLEFAMSRFFSYSSVHGLQLALLAALVSASSAQAQPSDAQCILAGRLDSQQRWAPQARGVQLLDASGQTVRGSGKEALATVKSVRLTQPALLASCSGNQPLPAGGDVTGKKPSPALSAGQEAIAVQMVAYPPLKVGGDLVELKLDVPSARVITLSR
jgi:hypothetical protein